MRCLVRFSRVNRVAWIGLWISDKPEMFFPKADVKQIQASSDVTLFPPANGKGD